MLSRVSYTELFHITTCVIIYFTICRNYEWDIFAKSMVPGCNGLPWGSTNLSYCLVHGESTSTWYCLSCVVIGMGFGVSVFEVSITAVLFPWGGTSSQWSFNWWMQCSCIVYWSLWHWSCGHSRLQCCIAYSLTISWRSTRSSCMVHVSN